MLQCPHYRVTQDTLIPYDIDSRLPNSAPGVQNQPKSLLQNRTNMTREVHEHFGVFIWLYFGAHLGK